MYGSTPTPRDLLLAYAINEWCDQFGHKLTGIAPYKNVNKG